MKKGLTPFLMLLLVMFIARSLVPTGFMPDFSGKHLITVCSGAAANAITVEVDRNNQPVHDNGTGNKTDDHKTSSYTCPFSFLSTTLLADPLAHTLLIDAPALIAAGMQATILLRAHDVAMARNHLNRGPPNYS